MHRPAPLSYRLLTSLAAPLLWRIARKKHARMGCDPARLSERKGIATHLRPKGPLLWCHAASLGELQSAVPLLRDLSAARPDLTLLVTTTTQSGAGLAAQIAQSLPLLHQFAPLDLAAPIHRFLAHWRPDAAILMENELLPRAAAALDASGIPQYALNLRPSRTRTRLPKLASNALARADLISAKDQSVHDDLQALGLAPAKLAHPGDLKAAADAPSVDETALKDLQTAIADRHCWLACSLHPEDDPIVWDAAKDILGTCPDTLLITIPRHVERAETMEAELAKRGLTCARRSRNDPLSAEIQIYLADSYGETGLFFRLCPTTYLGGGNGTRGGHNPWEPAALGSYILHGPDTANAADAFNALQKAHGAAMVRTAEDLAQTILSRLSAPRAQTPDTSALIAEGQTLRRTLSEHILQALPAQRKP